MEAPLFPPDFFAALAALSRRRARPGGGLAADPRAGTGLPGFEHRAYTPGDDLRRIDWRASARSARPQVRLRERERGGELRLVLDRSASLAPRHPRRDRDQRRLALAIGWLHLEGGGMVRLHAGDLPARLFAGFERRAALQALLEQLPPCAERRRGAAAAGLPGRLVWLTDPWSELPAAFAGGACVVSLVLPEEDEPPAGGLLLRGAEEGGELRIELDPAVFARRWEAWLAGRDRRLRALGARPVELRCGQVAAAAASLLQAAAEADLV